VRLLVVRAFNCTGHREKGSLAWVKTWTAYAHKHCRLIPFSDVCWMCQHCLVRVKAGEKSDSDRVKRCNCLVACTASGFTDLI